MVIILVSLVFGLFNLLKHLKTEGFFFRKCFSHVDISVLLEDGD